MQLKNFRPEEFFSPETFAIHGNKCMSMMDSNLLLFIENFHPFCAKHFGGKVSIVINDWLWGGEFSQRGFRDLSYWSDVDKFILSRSQHKFGRGLDFDVYVDKVRIDPAIIRQLIIDNRHLFFIGAINFIEDGVNWVHVDTRHTSEFLVVWHVSTGDVKTYG